MGSTRLAGKVLLPLGGATALAQCLRRVRSAPGLDAVWVATTDDPRDDAVVREAVRCGAEVFRGSEDDVLGRYLGAARLAQAEIVVRVTADCPLFDGALLGAMLGQFRSLWAGGERVDFMCNTMRRTYPRGLDTEIMTQAVLERLDRLSNRAYEREHVTPYVYEHRDEFAIRECLRPGEDLSALRWTLDTEEDYRFLSEIFAALPDDEAAPPDTDAVLALLRERPELAEINRHVVQKPAYASQCGGSNAGA